jgi:formamidopyrimidine-DNA glycosylase
VPELPEVETVVRDLRPQLVGRRLASLRKGPHRLRKPWRTGWDALLVGSRVRALRRRGKWIVLDLDGERHLVVHLGMTGQFTVADADAEVPAHTHLVFGLDGGERQLRFRDVRRFGSATLFGSADELEAFFARSGLGPEPFDLDAGYWRDRLAATGRCLKAVLLDQRVVAGVGNIYADESLFQARLHPTLLARDLPGAAAGRLRRAVAEVLTRAIDRRGSSIRDYVGGSGLRGAYQNEFRVYGRTDQPCLRCRTAIARIRLAGRSTHFCPACQKSCQLSAISRQPEERISVRAKAFRQ